MGYSYEIRHVEEILKPHLGNNTKILKSVVKRLTQPGENYGSLMLSVDLTVIDDSGKEKTLHLVAKMCPPNQWLREMFNIPVTFKKEESLYKDICVAMQHFEKEYGLSNMTYFLPKYYGSRLSLDANSNKVDDDAVLLLENLKLQGYEVGNRFEGFDLETSKAVVKALATFHSVTLALKLKKPNIFQSKVIPNIGKMKGFDRFTEEQRQAAEDFTIDVIAKYDEFTPYLDRIRNYYRQGEKIFQEGPDAREPFATIGHSDCWVNNILINKRHDTIDVKFVDFQIIDYGSPARDLIFFIYISVQNSVAANSDNELIQLYHNTFIEILQKFGCDTQPFRFTEFEKELQYEAKLSQLFHCLYMAKPIFAVKGTTKPMEELSAEDIFKPELSDKFEPKIVHILSSFIKNGWL